MKLSEDDIMVTVYRLNSHGGLNVGADCGVRITHVPTGLHTQSSEFRSQLANKAAALMELESKVALHYHREGGGENSSSTGD